VGDREDGAALCTFGGGASRRLCRCLVISRHNYGTPRLAAKTARIASIIKIKEILMAREALTPIHSAQFSGKRSKTIQTDTPKSTPA
jgi:hypothetical protein